MSLKVYGKLEKVQKGLTHLEKYFSMFAMAFIIVINIYGVSSRYIFNQPVLYIQELTILIGVWLFFIGIGLFFKVKSDIMVEVLVKYFPRRLRLINDLFVDLLILLFVIILAWQTTKYIPILRGQSESHALSFALELPDEIFFYPIGLGAISIFLTMFHSLVGRLIEFRSKWKQGLLHGGDGGES